MIGIAALWAATHFELNRDRESVRENVITSSANLARAIEEHALRTVSKIDLALLTLRRSYGKDPTKLSEHLVTIQETADKNLPLRITVIGSDGFLNYSYLGTVDPIDLSDREHFRVHRDSPHDTLFIGKPELDRADGQWLIQFSRKLVAPDGSFGGVIVHSVSPEYFDKFYQSLDIGENSNISLFGLDRVIRARVTSPPATEPAWGFVLPADRPYFDPALPDSGYFRVLGAIDGVERLFSWRRLKEYPLVVTVAPSVKEAFAEFEDRRRVALAIAGAASAVIALFAAILIWLFVRQDRARATLEREVKKRQETEAALRSNEQRLRTIIETEPECVKVVGRGGELLEMNAAGLAMLEVSSLGEAQQRRLLDFVVPKYKAAFNELFDRVLSGEAGTLEFEIIGSKGTRRWLKTHAAPLRESSGEVTMLLGVTTDITEAKQAETERETARQLLQDSLDSVSDGVALFDKDERLVLRNEHYLFRHNLPPGFLKPGITYPEIVTALVKHGAYINAGKDMADRRIRQFRALESAELRMFDIGKGECWVNVHLYRTRDGGTFLVRTDITERKRAEAELESSRQLLRSALDSMADGVALFDKHERLIMWNTNFVATRQQLRDFIKPGLLFAEVIGHLVKSGGYVAADETLVNELIRRFRALETFEVHMRDPDGRERWSLINHYRTGDGGTFLIRTDITKRKTAEDARRLSEARLRALVEHSPLSINIKDSNGLYLLVGSSWEKLWGIPAEQAIGKTSHQIHPKDLADQITKHDKDVLAAGKDLTREFVRLTPRGPRLLSVTKFPIYDEQKQPIAIGAIGADITAQRELEAELRQAQKMEAVGQLTAGVAHDFNNILEVIMGNLELAQEAIRDGKTKEKIANALDATHRGAALTSHLLSFGRRMTLHPVPTDFGDLIQSLDSLLRRTLGGAIEIKTILATALPPVLIDKNQMENVLINLALNARDAMPLGGLLTIKTAEVVLNEIQAKTLGVEVAPGRYVTIEVTDTGKGMAPEVASRVFEPFFTTKEIGKGSGLGLSMVYGFVKQSGGHAKIISEPGHGTSVTLYFLAAPGVAEEATRKSDLEPSNMPRGGDERILLVEDDKNVSDTIAAQLESLGYEVLRASDGPEALGMIKYGNRVSLVLSDVILKGSMNGLDVAAKLRELCPGLRFVFISGYPAGERRDDQGVKIRARHLRKPASREDLARAIREELDRVGT